MEKVFLDGVEGAKLALNIYEPENPVGIVQVFHGMAEHKERYDYFMNKLMEAGYVAAISDMRGHWTLRELRGISAKAALRIWCTTTSRSPTTFLKGIRDFRCTSSATPWEH